MRSSFHTCKHLRGGQKEGPKKTNLRRRRPGRRRNSSGGPIDRGYIAWSVDHHRMYITMFV